MGAPTGEHEARVEELRTLASLAGFTTDVRLPWRLRPDVARVCPRNLALLVADAKQTEDPACAGTLRRLRWYATALACLPQSRPVVLALAVPAATDADGWAQLLVAAISGHMVCETPRSTVIGGTVIVTTLAYHAAYDRRRPYSDRSCPARINSVLSAPSTSSAARAA